MSLHSTVGRKLLPAVVLSRDHSSELLGPRAPRPQTIHRHSSNRNHSSELLGPRASRPQTIHRHSSNRNHSSELLGPRASRPHRARTRILASTSILLTSISPGIPTSAQLKSSLMSLKNDPHQDELRAAGWHSRVTYRTSTVSRSHNSLLSTSQTRCHAKSSWLGRTS